MLFPSKPRSSNCEMKPRVLFLPSQRTVALSASVRTLRSMPSSDVGCAFRSSSIQSESPSTAAIRVGQATNRIAPARNKCDAVRSEEHTSELQSRFDLVCRLLLEKKKKKKTTLIE